MHLRLSLTLHEEKEKVYRQNRDPCGILGKPEKRDPSGTLEKPENRDLSGSIKKLEKRDVGP